MSRKYVVLIIDGASGWPRAEWGGLTSLEKACTPNLDFLAREGTLGLAHNVPDGMEASSAVACMSVMGYDPTVYYGGRGPIEAMALGIDLEPGEVAMRCNLVTVLDGRMVSYSAGDITSGEARELVETLRREVISRYVDGSGRQRLDLHPGVGFRNILTVRDGRDMLATTFTAPHDIADREVASFSPKGPGAALVEELVERSKEVLADHPVNRRREQQGLLPATQIWLFWPGARPGRMPSFAEAYGGCRAALTSGVDLLRGLAMQAGVDILDIPGVTDGGDNDYQQQMTQALAALTDHDLVFVHVEAPDAAAHAGDAEGKVRAIEQVDAVMLPQLLAGLKSDHGLTERLRKRPAAALDQQADELSILVLPDHPTPLALKTHVAEPVPFVMWGPGFRPNGGQGFSEKEARATGLTVAPGHLLMSCFLGSAPLI